MFKNPLNSIQSSQIKNSYSKTIIYFINFSVKEFNSVQNTLSTYCVLPSFLMSQCTYMIIILYCTYWGKVKLACNHSQLAQQPLSNSVPHSYPEGQKNQYPPAEQLGSSDLSMLIMWKNCTVYQKMKQTNKPNVHIFLLLGTYAFFLAYLPSLPP